MVTNKRSDTSVRISRWLDGEIEKYISNREISIEFPSKRNFVDKAIINILREKKVKLKK